jgi:hypothetical protein
MRLLAFAFVLLASSAAMATSPGPNIPKEYRGRWCSLGDSTYHYMPADDSCKRDVLEITEQYFGFPRIPMRHTQQNHRDSPLSGQKGGHMGA